MALSTGKNPSPWVALELVWEVFLSIAVPTTLFALAGRWLDARWHSTPWMTLFGLALALLVAYLLVMRKARQYLKSSSS